MSTHAVEDVKLSDELVEFVEAWKDKRGNLIMVLHRVQQEFGYLPWEVTLKLSELMEVPLARIHGVATFYHYFRLEKPGNHRLAVCMGTACYLKGAGDLIAELRNLLDIEIGGTTEDGELTVESVRCVGCCGLAPVVMVDDEVYGKLKDDRLPEILAEHRGKEPQGA